MDTHFTWIPFYMELADKLRAYADDRSALIQKVKALFVRMDIKLPTLESPVLRSRILTHSPYLVSSTNPSISAAPF